MATIVEVQVAAHDIALGRSFEAIPSLDCKIEQVVAADDFAVRLDGADLSSLTAALDTDPTVVTHSVLSGDGEQWLCTIDFADEVSELFDLVVAEKGAMLAAEAKNGRWTLRLQFPHQDAVSRVHDQLAERGIRIDIIRLQPFSTITADKIDLTPEQYEALVAAIDHGFFEIPRETSLEELAAELDISHQALSERFRRAHQTLVTAKLDLEEESEPVH